MIDRACAPAAIRLRCGRSSIASGPTGIKRQIIVFDAAGLDAESRFWVGVLGGSVVAEDDWHIVVAADGVWRIGKHLGGVSIPRWGSIQCQACPAVIRSKRSVGCQCSKLDTAIIAPCNRATAGIVQKCADPSRPVTALDRCFSRS